ncbi:MAG: serine hydrolase [Hyphomicrobiaceae bacterium]
MRAGSRGGTARMARIAGGLGAGRPRSSGLLFIERVKSLVAGTILLSALSLSQTDAAAAADRYAAIVIDANTGAILHEQDADELRYPASLTKMMTLYLVFEGLSRGSLKPTTPIRMTADAAAAPPSKLGLDAGEAIPLMDAVKVLITKSANDVAAAIADHVAGSEEKFAAMMTAKARRFGMSRTTFRNASGLPNPEQTTTARDMAILVLRLQDDFPQYYRLFSTRYASFGGRRFRNHNNLLFKFHGTDGVKTGYTRASGFNLAASVRRGRRAVVGVVFGGKTAARRDDAMRLLITRALFKASTIKTRKPRPVLVATARPAQRPPSARPPVPAPAGSPAWTKAAQVALRPTYQAAVHPSAPPRQVAPPAIRPPSTLQQQAANLQHGFDPHVPTPVTVAVVGPQHEYSPQQHSAYRRQGDLEIQIGAFSSAADAVHALSTAREAAEPMLAGRLQRTEPVNVGRRQLVRARFGGFDAAAATAACNELRRQNFDCFVASTVR